MTLLKIKLCTNLTIPQYIASIGSLPNSLINLFFLLSEMMYGSINRFILPVTVLCLVPSGFMLNLQDKNLTEVPNLVANTDSILLGFNNITFVHSHAFQNVSGLEYLRMSNNKLEDIADDAFEGTAIITLGLSHNRLVKLPYLGFITSTLVNLKLNNNFIDAVSETDIQGANVLRTLCLNKNPLTFVTDVVALLPSLKEFSVEAIQFKCCQPVMHLKDVPESVLQIDIAPCIYPTHLVGVKWTDITRDQLQRQPCGRFL